MNRLLFITLLLPAFTALAGQPDHSASLNGSWYIEFSHQDIGMARTHLFMEAEGRTFQACTRKNADRDVLGNWTAWLGRTFTKTFKNGSLLRVVNGSYTANNDSIKLSGVLTSALGNYYFNGTISGDKLHARLTNGKGEERGQMQGVKRAVQQPLEDYQKLFNASQNLTENMIYNREIMQSKEWKKFTKDMNKVCGRIQDDLEMVFAFFHYSGKLPVSHYAMMKIPDARTSMVAAVEGNVFLEEKTPETAYLRITSFGGSAAEMDSVMNLVQQKNYKNLVVDLRNNSGGSVEAGMAFATSVAESSFYGGVFLTQKWFNSHTQPPTVENYSSFPHFTAANYDLIIAGIHSTDGLCLKVVPKPQVFAGKLYILINGATASTCEPLVYGLKQQKRAVLVGERTAGAMLNGERFELDKGFKMVIPTAEYYTSDGYRIDQKGVEPDVTVNSEKALDYVLNNLIN